MRSAWRSFPDAWASAPKGPQQTCQQRRLPEGRPGVAGSQRRLKEPQARPSGIFQRPARGLQAQQATQNPNAWRTASRAQGPPTQCHAPPAQPSSVLGREGSGTSTDPTRVGSRSPRAPTAAAPASRFHGAPSPAGRRGPAGHIGSGRRLSWRSAGLAGPPPVQRLPRSLRTCPAAARRPQRWPPR